MRDKKQVRAESQEQPPIRLEWRTPQELAENPRNWRKHGEKQTSALMGTMQSVGWAGALLFNEFSGKLIDGHLRRKLALEQGSEKVPVLVGSWTEAQEKLILATLDPIGALAETDTAQLDALIREIDTGDPAIMEMIARLAEENGITPPNFEPVGIDEQGKLDEKSKISCPECGYEFTP